MAVLRPTPGKGRELVNRLGIGLNNGDVDDATFVSEPGAFHTAVEQL